MKKTFSEISLRLARPIIEDIYAWLEFHLIRYPDYEKDTRFLAVKMESKWPSSDFYQAMSIISTWLDPKLFKTSSVDIIKLSPKAKWSDLYKTIEKNLKTKKEDTKIQTLPKMEIAISKSGKISRIVSDKELKCQFKKGSKRLKLLAILKENEDLSNIDRLMNESENKTKPALRKMIGEINNKVGICLQLPKDKKFIVGEGGYSLNPDYHVVFTV